MSVREQLQLRAQINSHLLQNAFAQRQQWREQYGLTDKQLFELFSEFTAMIMLTRQELNDQDPTSLVSRFNNSEEGRDYLKDVLRVGGKLSRFNKERLAAKQKEFKLTTQDLADFRVPVTIFMTYCKALQSVDRENRRQAMIDAGIKLDYKAAKIDWQQFLHLNQLIKSGTFNANNDISL